MEEKDQEPGEDAGSSPRAGTRPAEEPAPPREWARRKRKGPGKGPFGDGLGSPLTLTLCATAIVLSIAGWTSAGLDPFLLDNRAYWREPWRLLSAHFVHANALHLGLNLYWAWKLGPLMEERLGELRMLAWLVFVGVGTSFAVHAFDRGGIGLSGIVYGMWSFLAVASRRSGKYRGLVDARTNQMFIGWFFFCIAATALNVLTISNWGHGSGAVLGALLGLVVSARPAVARILIAGSLALLGMLACAATLWRPSLNFGGGALDYAAQGAADLERSEWIAAEKNFRTALRLDGKAAWAWWNLGCALSKLGRTDESIDAAYRAFEIGPIDAEQHKYLVDVLRWSVDLERRRGTKESVFKSATRVVTVSPDDTTGWELVKQLARELDQQVWLQKAENELSRLGVHDP